MADIIETNINAMEQDIKDMRDVLKKIRQDMNGMFDAVIELDNTWSGSAKEAFKKQFLTDKMDFEEICTAVENIIESMENAKNSYRKCEAEIEQEITRIPI